MARGAGEPLEIRQEILLALLLVCALALPQISRVWDALWIDEIYTLALFASLDFVYPFTTYSLANNHMLFSALLSTWYEPGLSVAAIRFPLLLIHAVSLLLIYLGARRFGGQLMALFALALYASSWAITSFNMELRGYALSFPLTTLLWYAGWRLSQRLSPGAALLYLLASSALLLTIPTNLIVVAIVGSWTMLSVWQSGTRSNFFVLMGLLALSPLPALLVYLAHFEELMALSSKGLSNWSRAEAAVHIAAVFLLPALVAIALALFGTVRMLGNRRFREDPGNQQMALLLGLTVVWVLVVLLSLPTPPFPRIFLPVLPLLYLSLAWFAACGLPRLELRQPLYGAVLVLLLASFPLISMQRDLCSPDSFGANGRNGLCYQTYNDDFQPKLLVASLRQHFAPEPLTLYGFSNSYPELDAALDQVRDDITLRSLFEEFSSEQLRDDGGVSLVVIYANRDIQDVMRKSSGEGSFKLSKVLVSPHYAVYRVQLRDSV